VPLQADEGETDRGHQHEMATASRPVDALYLK
jgi:hypothetical protein